MREINYKFKKDNTLEELQIILKANSFYEKTYSDSRFLSIINYKDNEPFPHFGIQNFRNESIEIINYTTVIASNHKGKPIGILIFENYKSPSRTKFFVCDGKKEKYNMNGFVCLYVKPKYREKGIAQNMVQVFNSQYSFDENAIQLISGVQATSNILKEFAHSFVYTKSPYHSTIWKETAKSYKKYYSNKENVSI